MRRRGRLSLGRSLTSWAARTISPLRQAHALDRMKLRQDKHRLVVAVTAAVCVAFAAAGSTPAQPTPEAGLAKRLARALVVPHVNQSRTAAFAVDLATGR